MAKATAVVKQVCQPKFKVPDCAWIVISCNKWNHFLFIVVFFFICILALFETAMNTGQIPEDKNFKVTTENHLTRKYFSEEEKKRGCLHCPNFEENLPQNFGRIQILE